MQRETDILICHNCPQSRIINCSPVEIPQGIAAHISWVATFPRYDHRHAVKQAKITGDSANPAWTIPLAGVASNHRQALNAAASCVQGLMQAHMICFSHGTAGRSRTTQCSEIESCKGQNRTGHQSSNCSGTLSILSAPDWIYWNLHTTTSFVHPVRCSAEQRRRGFCSALHSVFHNHDLVTRLHR